MSNETVVSTYRVRTAGEKRFRELLATHWALLHRLGFTTEAPSQSFRSLDEPPTYIEIFTWREGGFSDARQHPEVLATWEAMEPLLEDRGDQPKWDFPHFTEVSLST